MTIHPTTMASAPFVTQHSVASFCLIITGIPLHSANMPGWCSVLPCDRFHNFSCIDLTTLSDDRNGSIVFLTPFVSHCHLLVFSHLSIE